MKHLFLAATLAAISTAPAFAQSAKVQPGNCAIWAEMTAETVQKDKRFKGTSVAKSLRKYAAAQDKIVKAGMADTYKQSKAFGWDKATVDAKMKQAEDALRKGFRTSTMEKNKVYMDHVVAVNRCAQAAKTEAELGQAATDMLATLNTLAEIAQKG